MKIQEHDIRELGLSVIKLETEAITALAEQINENFVTACKLMMQCKGRVVVMGGVMGILLLVKGVSLLGGSNRPDRTP